MHGHIDRQSLVSIKYATYTSSIRHFICPPKFCITFAFHFSWVLQPPQEKLKTMLVQNVKGGGGGGGGGGGANKAHYGKCASGVWAIL